MNPETQLNIMQKLLALNEQVADHLRRQWPKWVMLLAMAFVFQQRFMLLINVSPSLPQKVFIITKGESVHKGDYAAFNWHGQGGFYVNQPYFTKIVKGVAGDVLTVNGLDVLINGQVVAHAKVRSSKGGLMEMVQPKVLAEGEFYMYAPNPNSLDSRYSVVGCISAKDIIGRARPIF
jgi:conjugal transfer pilin signal peptidase TrbI